MTWIAFAENAGENLLGATDAPSALIDALRRYIGSQRLSAQGLQLTYDAAAKTVTVKGVAPDQAMKEKILLCCGNVRSVAGVDDQLTVAQNSPAFPASTLYEVKAEDTLGTIAKAVYGDENGYEPIVEANKPMLTDPRRLYPGQVLRVPPK